MLLRHAQFSLWLFTLLLVVLHNPTICLASTAIATEHRDVIFQEVIEGEVEFENFTYYIVDSDEDITLNLTSLAGDCDLYVSQARRPGENPPNPTIETHSYDLQSTTCGEDVITITRELVRPFCIGIYAHPSYHLCMYRLEITGTRSLVEIDPEYEFDRRESYEPIDEVPSHDEASRRQQQQHQQQQHSKRSASKESSEFDSFLELLLNITIQCLGFLFEIIL